MIRMFTAAAKFAIVMAFAIPIAATLSFASECNSKNLHDLTKAEEDSQIPKSMYPPSWPTDVTVFMRVVHAGPTRVTSWLDAGHAKQGVDLFTATSLKLPPGATIIDVSVRLRAVEQHRAGSGQGYPIELGYWNPGTGVNTDRCRLQEYGINQPDPFPYPVASWRMAERYLRQITFTECHILPSETITFGCSSTP